MDYLSCYKIDNKSTPFQEEKNSPKLKDCEISQYFNFGGIHTLVFIKCQKKLKFLYFLHMYSGKVSAYQTGSAFT